RGPSWRTPGKTTTNTVFRATSRSLPRYRVSSSPSDAGRNTPAFPDSPPLAGFRLFGQGTDAPGKDFDFFACILRLHDSLIGFRFKIPNRRTRTKGKESRIMTSKIVPV